MKEHFPQPWKIVRGGTWVQIQDAHGGYITEEDHGDRPERKAIIESLFCHIIACVNACGVFSTEDLEDVIKGKAKLAIMRLVEPVSSRSGPRGTITIG